MARLKAAAADEYDDLSLEDLDHLIIDLSNERGALREKQLAVTAAYDRKANAAKAARLTENLTDPEKAALLQQLEVDGIDASGVVGAPVTSGGN